METYEFSEPFQMGSLLVTPVHVRVEQLPPIIAAHTHSNTSYEIHYTVSGRGRVLINGQSHPVEPDTLYITGPRIVHAQFSDPAAPITEHCLYLNCVRTSQDGAGPFVPFIDTTFWMGRDENRVAPLMRQLIEENRTPRTGWREMSETILKQIVILLARIYRQGKPQPRAAVSAPALTRAGLMPVIEDAFFYRYRTLTLGSLARLLNISERQTQRLLQKDFGKTFSQKLTEARMAAAAQFLANTSLSVTDISERLGYSSIEHFSSAFKRATGTSPRQYRRQRAQTAHPTDFSAID